MRGEEFKKALQVARENGIPLGQTLVDLGLITPENLRDALATDSGIQTINLSHVVPSPEALEKVSAAVARQYSIVPLSFEQGRLKIAMADPRNFTAIDELQFVLNCEIISVLATPEQIAAAMERYYRS
jgi:type IV pilus assembly protein PilB